MEAELKISHRGLLDSMPIGVIQADRDGIIQYANSFALQLLGVNLDDLVGKHYSHRTHFKDGQVPLTQEDHVFYTVLHHRESVSGNVQGAMIEGKVRWFSINAAPIYDNEKNLIGGIATFDDVTERIENEQKRREEAGRYKILVENINGVVWESTAGTKTYTYLSPKVSELLGFPAEEWLKEGFWQSRLHEDDKERIISIDQEQYMRESSYQLEYRLIHQRGQVVWIKDMIEVVREDGKPAKLRGLMIDITDSKMSRMLLRQSEKRYKEMIIEAPYAITIYDKEGTLIAANEKCKDYWLIDPKEYIGVFNIFDNDLFIKENQRETIRRAFNGEQGEITSEIPLTHAGARKTYRIKYYPLLDREGKLDNVVYFTEDITEYVEARKSIEREESLKQGVLDALDKAIVVVDGDGTIISTNRNLQVYVESQLHSELEVGQSIFDFTHYFDEGEDLANGLKRVLDRKIQILDHEMKLSDGKWYNLRVTPLKDPFGAVIAWQNINTRKEMELALERSLRKYRNIYNKAPVMMHSINEKLEIISVSDYWLEKMGYERNEVIGKTPIDFMTEDSMSTVATNLKALFEKGEVKNVEYRYMKKSGEIIDVMLSAVSEFDENGNFERSITGMLDVTELKATERKLQESQFKLLEAQRISKIANYEFEIESGIFSPSDEMIAMMGFEPEQRHVSIIQKLIHPDDLPGFEEKLNMCIAEGKDFFHIYRIIHLKTKALKWISGRGKMMKDSRGKVTRMIGTIQDITEQKHAEDKIRRLTDRVLLATEIANLAVWEMDSETNEMFWEDQMYSIFTDATRPLSLEEFQLRYLDDSNKLILKRGLKMIREGTNFMEFEIKVVVQKEEKYLRSFVRVLRDISGKMKGMVGVFYNITIDKMLQKRLESSLEEKNVLIKEVHHRVKNNIQLISSILALKSYDLKTDKSKAIFEEVNNRIKAMAVIHDKLYKFYNVSEIDLSDYLIHIAQELQILLGTSLINIEVKSDPLVMDVEKALLLGLMVSEMVSNAIKHGYEQNETGTITIFLTREQQTTLLRVINDGKIIGEDILQRKIGLGISLIKTFAKQLKGTVERDADNGFRVSF